MYCRLRGRAPGDDGTGHDDVSDGRRKQELPSEGHQLVITEAWQRATHPDIEKDKEADLHDEPECWNKRRDDGRKRYCRYECEPFERAVPSAEKEQRSDAGCGEHVGVLGNEEHGELHGGVFGMVSGDEFGL